MKVENEREETDMINKTECPVKGVTREEVNMALSKTSNGKACRPSEVSAVLLKAVGEYGIYWIHVIMKDVWNRGKVPGGWRKREIVPIGYTNRREMLWSVEAIEE